MKKIFPLIISVLVASIFLFFRAGNTVEAAVTDVCPAGDVKVEWMGSGYVYVDSNDGSVIVTGTNRTINWSVTSGYNITGICIKYGNNLAYPAAVSTGSWSTPSYDISSAVFYTKPTLVEITSLSVSKNSLGRAVISWETGSELDVVGFNVYRSLYPNGPYYKRNTILIPPQYPGSVMGASYSWTDPVFLKPGIYYYKLQQIDVQGQSSFHGPVVLDNFFKLVLPPDTCDSISCGVYPVLLF